MSKKGLSYEEKCKRLASIFYERKEFFQLKELEKIAPKAKGIVAQSVKEVLQSLVDDGIVTAEKIGTSNYFWSFPSAALQSRQTKLSDLEAESKKTQTVRDQLKSQIDTAQQGREDSHDRAQLLQKVAEAEQLKSRYLSDLEALRDLDPDAFAEKERQTRLAKEAANRWTDNVFSLQSYCSEKYNLERASFIKEFEVPEDLDYV